MLSIAKSFLKTSMGSLVQRAPLGLVENLFEHCSRRIGYFQAAGRLFGPLQIAEVGVRGDLGLIRASSDDRVTLELYRKNGIAEGTICREIKAFFGDSGGTYFDVGANIGLTTIPISLNRSVRCIAFEPEPRNFHHLMMNVRENVEAPNVEFVKVALFDKAATVSFSMAIDNIGDHRITHGPLPGRHTIQVEALPLDHFYDRIHGPLAVKIDTQGAEPAVLAGGQKVLARAGLVAMEFCPYLMRQLGGDPRQVVDFADKFDTVAIIEPATDERPDFISPSAGRERLLRKIETARDADSDYYDVILRRRV